MTDESLPRLLRAIDLADPDMEHNEEWLIKRGDVVDALAAANFPYDDEFVQQVAAIINHRPANPFDRL